MGLVTPTDRKLRHEFDVRPADKNGAVPGDIVWIEATGGALSRRARVIERIGPMSDPRTVSLISIAANDIPVEFPEAAARRSRARQGRAARPSPRPARACRWSPSTARMRATSTTRCSPSPIPDHPGGWRLLVAIADVAWYVRPRQAARPRRLPAAAPRSISPTASCRCCPRRCPTTGARWCRARTGRCWWPRCRSTPRARSSATASTAP